MSNNLIHQSIKTLTFFLFIGVLNGPLSSSALAQMNATLPNKTTVAQKGAMPIDGIWTISSINKRIRIEGGRAYAVDPWLHAFVLQIKPGMVVIKNIQRLEAGAYIGEDLPLLGNAKFKLRPDGNIGVSVAGAMGTVRYKLMRVSVDDQSTFNAELSETSFGDNDAFKGVTAERGQQIEKWYVYIRHVWCTGSNVAFVKDATGTVSVKAYQGNNTAKARTTKNKTVSAKCKKKKKKTTYSYKAGGAGLLGITGTRKQIQQYTVKYTFDWYYGKKGRKTQNDYKTFKRPVVLVKGLPVGQSQDYEWFIDGKLSPDFYLNVRFKRVE